MHLSMCDGFPATSLAPGESARHGLPSTDYEYDQTWIEQRQALLARLFAIEIGWLAHATPSFSLSRWACDC
jgi:hypothetical protein